MSHGEQMNASGAHQIQHEKWAAHDLSKFVAFEFSHHPFEDEEGLR